jgi:hypothetical protein
MSNDLILARDWMRILLTALVLASCKLSGSPYDRLCTIYEGLGTVADENLDWWALAQRITNEAPEIAEDHQVVMLNEKGRRYELFRQRAIQDWKQPSWQCEAIKKRWPPE